MVSSVNKKGAVNERRIWLYFVILFFIAALVFYTYFHFFVRGPLLSPSEENVVLQPNGPTGAQYVKIEVNPSSLDLNGLSMTRVLLPPVQKVIFDTSKLNESQLSVFSDSINSQALGSLSFQGNEGILTFDSEMGVPTELTLGQGQVNFDFASESYIVEFNSPSLSEQASSGVLSASSSGDRKEELKQEHSNALYDLARLTNGGDVLSATSTSGDNGNSGNSDFVVEREYYNTINGVALGNVSADELDKIKSSSYVKAVYPDKRVQAFLSYSVPMIGAPDVWNQQDAKGRNLTGKGITIAVIDTGVDYNHPDLGGCFGAGCKVVGGFDFVNGDSDPMDDMGHGTHVAATVAGKVISFPANVSTNYSNGEIPDPMYGNGVAPDAKILAYKVLNYKGSGSWSQVLAGIDAAVDPNGDGDLSDHADILTMSLGARCGASYSQDCGPDDIISRAVDRAVDAGVVATIAAGNSFSGVSNVGSPGTARNAITVGAIAKDRSIADFGSRGPVVWARGTLIKPDVFAPGVDICAAQASGDTIWADYYPGRDIHCGDDRHIFISGTSMATPHVAGAVALIKQAHPDWTPEDIKEALVNSADYNLNVSSSDYFAMWAGLINITKAISNNVFVSNVVFGVINTTSQTAQIKIKNLANQSVHFNINLEPTTRINIFSYSDPVSKVNGLASTDSEITLGAGETKFENISLDVPSNTNGTFEGRIMLYNNDTNYSNFYSFSRVGRLKLSFPNHYPNFLIYMGNTSSDDFASTQISYLRSNNGVEWVAPVGDYKAYALSDFVVDPLYVYAPTYKEKDEYVLGVNLSVGYDSFTTHQFSLSDGRPYTFEPRSKNDESLYLSRWDRQMVFCSSYNSGSCFPILLINTAPPKGDKVVTISDSIKDNYDTDALFRYGGYKSGSGPGFTGASEEYYGGWLVHNPDNSTPSIWSSNYSSMSEINYSSSYPGTYPATYLDWPILRLPSPYYFDAVVGYDGFVGNRSVYLYTPKLSSAYTPWSFEYSKSIIYILNRSFATFGSSNILETNVEKDLSKPLKESVSFGSPAYQFAHLTVSNSRLQLIGNLLSDGSGKVKFSRGDLGEYNLTNPSYSIYRNGNLTNNKNLSFAYEDCYQPYGCWIDEALLDGRYEAVINVPTYYPVFENILIHAWFNKNTNSFDLPWVDKLSIPQQFSSRYPISLSFAGMGSTFNATAFASFDGGQWISISLANSSGNYSGSIVPSQGVKRIDIKIELNGTSGNMEYYIKSASLASVIPTIIVKSDAKNVKEGDEVHVWGEVFDNENSSIYIFSSGYMEEMLQGHVVGTSYVTSEGASVCSDSNCSWLEPGQSVVLGDLQFNLVFTVPYGYYYAAGVKISPASVEHIKVRLYDNGNPIGSVITNPYVSSGLLQFSAPGTFDYTYIAMENESVNVSADLETVGSYSSTLAYCSVEQHDLAISTINVPLYFSGKEVHVKFRVTNNGQFSEQNIHARMHLVYQGGYDSFVNETVISSLAAGESKDIDFVFTPFYSLMRAGVLGVYFGTKLEVDPVPGETSLFDNKRLIPSPILNPSDQSVDVSTSFNYVGGLNSEGNIVVPVSVFNSGYNVANGVSVKLFVGNCTVAANCSFIQIGERKIDYLTGTGYGYFIWNPSAPGNYILKAVSSAPGDVNPANDVSYCSVYVYPSYVDVSPYIEPSTMDYQENTPSTVYVDMHNYGNVNAKNVTVLLSYTGVDGQYHPIGSKVFDFVYTSIVDSQGFSWTPENAGDYTLRAEAIVANDSNLYNNVNQINISVTGRGPDASISLDSSMRNRVFYAGKAANVSVKISNYGSVDIFSGVVGLYDSNETGFTNLNALPFGKISPGDSNVVDLEFIPMRKGILSLYANVSAEGDVNNYNDKYYFNIISKVNGTDVAIVNNDLYYDPFVLNKVSWIYVPVINVGSEDALNVSVELYDNGIFVSRRIIANLSGHSGQVQEYQARLSYIPRKIGAKNLTVKVVLNGDQDNSDNFYSFTDNVSDLKNITLTINNFLDGEFNRVIIDPLNNTIPVKNSTVQIQTLFGRPVDFTIAEYKGNLSGDFEILHILNVHGATLTSSTSIDIGRYDMQIDGSGTHYSVFATKLYVPYNYTEAFEILNGNSSIIPSKVFSSGRLTSCESFNLTSLRCDKAWNSANSSRIFISNGVLMLYRNDTHIEAFGLEIGKLNVNKTLRSVENEYGSIKFDDADLSQLENDQVYAESAITIDNKLISVNTTSLRLNNTNANLTFMGLNFVNPIVLHEGIICPSNICSSVKYNKPQLTVRVNNFSTYQVVEGPYCGDNICQPSYGEVCDGCVADCGICNQNNSNPVGNAGNGNSGGGSESSGVCSPDWSCQWTPCANHQQKYSCVDIDHCGSQVGKPSNSDATQVCLTDANCVDKDGDGYGVGTGCLGPDLNDNDPGITVERDTGTQTLGGKSNLIWFVVAIILAMIIALIVILIRLLLYNKREVENIPVESEAANPVNSY